MEDELRKRKLLLIGIAAGMLVVFGYGFYAVMGGVSSAKVRYLDTYKELVVLEQNQQQAQILREELEKTASERKEIMDALLAQTYEDQLQLVIQFETIAKITELEYELQILRELTEESIAEERARIANARRKTKAVKEQEAALEEKFPSITFSIKLKGDYTGVVKFFENLMSLPYYISIDNFSISKKVSTEEGVYAGVEVVTQVTVYTR